MNLLGTVVAVSMATAPALTGQDMPICLRRAQSSSLRLMTLMGRSEYYALISTRAPSSTRSYIQPAVFILTCLFLSMELVQHANYLK